MSNIFSVEDEEGYLDKFPIREPIKDNATFLIRYTMAVPSKAGMTITQ